MFAIKQNIEKFYSFTSSDAKILRQNWKSWQKLKNLEKSWKTGKINRFLQQFAEQNQFSTYFIDSLWMVISCFASDFFTVIY